MSRADRIAGRLAERKLDLLLVTDRTNLRYMTGFTGTNGMAVVGADLRRFVTDFRYLEQAAQQVPDFDREQGPPDFVTGLAEGWPPGELRLGFEDAHVSARMRDRIREVLPDRIELVAAGDLVEAERAVKDEGELERIRLAARMLDDIYAWLREWGIVGRTEREVGLALEHEMRLRGASDPSFPSIVASGPRGALPHAVRTDEPIPRGTLVTLDIGAVLDGYCSDCTRTWSTGEGLPGELRDAYELVLRAQQAAVAAVRPGPTGREVDAVARDDDRGGRPRRALRARARPRGRPGRPRGPAAVAHRFRSARRGQRRHRGARRLPPRRGRRPHRGSGDRHRVTAARCSRAPPGTSL